MQANKFRIIGLPILLSLIFITNGPLFYIIWLHDSKTIMRIVGHAPNQFLFLLLFLPAAAWMTYKTVFATMQLADEYVELKKERFWKIIMNKGILLVSSVLIALSFATVDHVSTPSDFYQFERNRAKEAALRNHEFIAAAVLATKNQDEYQSQKETADHNRKMLLDLYDKPQVDKVMKVLEYMELTAVGFLVSIIMWVGFLHLKIVRFTNSNSMKGGKNNKLKKGLVQVIPYSVSTILLYLFWPPLRLYNIYEIKKVVTDYETMDPTFGYILAAILSITLCWIYYNKTNPKFFKLTAAIITFFASGALMGFVKLRPESLVEIIGSSMGFGNLFILVFVVGLTYLFGSEILQQMRTKI